MLIIYDELDGEVAVSRIMEIPDSFKVVYSASDNLENYEAAFDVKKDGDEIALAFGDCYDTTQWPMMAAAGIAGEEIAIMVRRGGWVPWGVTATERAMMYELERRKE